MFIKANAHLYTHHSIFVISFNDIKTIYTNTSVILVQSKLMQDQNIDGKSVTLD